MLRRPSLLLLTSLTLSPLWATAIAAPAPAPAAVQSGTVAAAPVDEAPVCEMDDGQILRVLTELHAAQLRFAHFTADRGDALVELGDGLRERHTLAVVRTARLLRRPGVSASETSASAQVRIDTDSLLAGIGLLPPAELEVGAAELLLWQQRRLLEMFNKSLLQCAESAALRDELELVASELGSDVDDAQRALTTLRPPPPAEDDETVTP